MAHATITHAWDEDGTLRDITITTGADPDDTPQDCMNAALTARWLSTTYIADMEALTTPTPDHIPDELTEAKPDPSV